MMQLAQKHYTEQEIIDQLHLVSGSRYVDFRFDLLDSRDRKIGELSDITGSISYSSLTQIKGTARFTMSIYEKREINFLNEQIQPIFRLKMPDGRYAEWPQGVYLISSPAKKLESREIEAYDKTIMLKQGRFRSRYVFPAGTNIVNAMINVAGMAGIYRVEIPANDAKFGTTREFEAGQEYIEAFNTMADLINYTSAYVTPNGILRADPYQTPENRTIDYHYVDDQNDIMFMDATEELDTFGLANEIVVTASSPEIDTPISTFVQNNNLTSPISIPNRGRIISKHYDITDPLDPAALKEYAMRRLIEESQVYNKIVFSTATMPMHTYVNTLFIRHRVLKSAGKFSETSWSMELKTGGKMTHEARRMVYL